MSERRFVIREWGEGDPNPGWSITESEFKRRFRITVDKWKYDRPWEMILTILLHGEGEKGNPPQAG